jgi:repressor LexA
MDTRTRILGTITDCRKKNGFSPTVREIGDMVELKSSGAVHRHLEVLKKQGKIDWNPDMPGTIRVLEGLGKRQ